MDGVVFTNLQFHFLSLDAPMAGSVVMVSPEHIKNIIASPKATAKRTYLRCIRIQRSIVYIHREVNGTSESDVLRRRSHRRVGEEEGHRGQSPDHHRVPPSKILPIAQEAGRHGSEDAHCVGDHVVPPRVVRAILARLGATAREEFRQEDIEQRIGEPD